MQLLHYRKKRIYISVLKKKKKSTRHCYEYNLFIKQVFAFSTQRAHFYNKELIYKDSSK